MIEPEWIPIGHASKLLDRTINGVKGLGRRGFLDIRFVQKGNRKVREIKLSTVLKVIPLLSPRKRIKHPSYKVIKEKSGYLKLYNPEHPRAMCDGYVYEHWLVAEKKLGRHLHKQEHVHHINRIRDDNRPSNIFVYSSRSLHMKMSHSKLSKILNSIHVTEDQRFICPHCTKEIQLDK